MDPDYARDVLREIDRRRKAREAQVQVSDLVDRGFPEQARFVEDSSQFVNALCTRRAGKSHGLGLRLFRAALRHPGELAIHIGLTRLSTHAIMWPVLTAINKRYRIGATPTESDLTWTLPNGSMIRLVGADQKNFIERLRGPKYSEAQIDEGQSFRSHLETLIDDILTAACADLRASIVVTGTPGPLPSGFFYEACEKDLGFSKHKWTLYQNPYFPDPRGFVEKLKKKKKWTDKNPTYQREWLGKWVIDLDALVYKFNRDKNLYRELPAGHDYLRILVIDYGYDDHTAFGVTTYSRTLRKVFLEHAEGHPEMIPSEIAAKAIKLRDTFSPFKILADTGALGKMITEEMRRRYHLPIHPAEKKDKLTHISLMNGDFVDGNLLVKDTLTALHDQFEALTKADDGLEDPKLPNDLCDVSLYGYREAQHYLGETKVDPPPPGSKESYDREAEEMEKRELERLEEEERERKEAEAQAFY